MARHASALKAARQALKHREANRQTRGKVKSVVKQLRDALTQKAASKNVIKKETASRQIARLSAAVHRVTA